MTGEISFGPSLNAIQPQPFRHEEQFIAQGIGGALIRDGVARMTDRAERLVFVLGDPAYYGRFGFTVMGGFASRYAGLYFQALMLSLDAPKSGRVSYPKPFDDLG